MTTDAWDLSGRTVVITGAGGGIGLETTRRLAQLGAQVVMVGRNPLKMQQAASEVRAAASQGRIDVLMADLSIQAQVRRLASELLERYPQLHVLIHNAGVVMPERRLSADGIELNLAVNHLAPFLLTHLLQDRLRASAPARVINVGSSAQQRARLDLGNPADLHRISAQSGYSMFGAYGRSKLLQTLSTYEFARRLQGSGVTANILHPGAVNTGLGHEIKGPLGVFWKVVSRFLLTPEQGARTSVYVAQAPELERVSGRYFVGRKAARSNPLSYDEGLARRVWNESLRLTGLEADSLEAD